MDFSICGKNSTFMTMCFRSFRLWMRTIIAWIQIEVKAWMCASGGKCCNLHFSLRKRFMPATIQRAVGQPLSPQQSYSQFLGTGKLALSQSGGAAYSQSLSVVLSFLNKDADTRTLALQECTGDQRRQLKLPKKGLEVGVPCLAASDGILEGPSRVRLVVEQRSR